MVQIGLEFAIESNFAGLNVEVEATLINSRMSSDWNYYVGLSAIRVIVSICVQSKHKTL